MVFGVGVFLWQKVEARGDRNRRREQRKEEFGKDPRELSCGKRSREFLAEVAVYYEERKEQGGEGLSGEENFIDDVTWNDLDMDELFLRVNHTKSYIGEQVLYRRLHETKERDWEKWEEHLSYFSQKEKEREELWEALWRIGKEREAYYLPMFLKNAAGIAVEHLWVYRMLQFLLFGGLFAGILTGNPLFFGISGVTALINVSVYVMSKDKYEVYLYSLGSVRELLAFHKLLAEREEWRKLFVTEELITAWERTKDLWKSIGKYQGKKRAALSGDAFAVFADYLNGATLRDITAFGHIAKQLTEKERELFLLYEAAGEIDLEIAVSSFRKSLAVWCVPELRGQDGTADTAHRKGQSSPKEKDALQAKGQINVRQGGRRKCDPRADDSYLHGGELFHAKDAGAHVDGGTRRPRGGEELLYPRDLLLKAHCGCGGRQSSGALYNRRDSAGNQYTGAACGIGGHLPLSCGEELPCGRGNARYGTDKEAFGGVSLLLFYERDRRKRGVF